MAVFLFSTTFNEFERYLLEREAVDVEKLASGAGKSTVQNILTGLLPLQQGKVTYEGNSSATSTPPF